MNYIARMRAEYDRQNVLLKYYKTILKDLRSITGRLELKKNGTEYYIVENNKEIYASFKKMKKVNQLKLKKLLETAVKRLEVNIKALERALKECQPYDYDALNEAVSPAYKGAFLPAPGVNWRADIPPFTQSENPLYPEELIHTTSFGLKTRTKGEMEIAELLYKLGIPFRYEMRLVLMDENGNPKVVYPDFSIPLEDDWFFIEHLGLLNKERYRKRNAEKLHEYHSNGIFMPGQLIFTMDGPDGGLDAGPVMEFLQNMLLPKLQMAEKEAVAEI